jgi:hypothetical protein
LHLFGAEVKNVYRYISIPTICIHSLHRDNLTFTFSLIPGKVFEKTCLPLRR